jgi:hypothetical protein
MTEFNLSANLDYTNRKINASLFAAGTGHTDFSSSAVLTVTDGKGTVIACDPTMLAATNANPSVTMYRSSLDFGLKPVSLGYLGGYDTSIVRTDLSGLYVTEAYSNWEFSRDTSNASLLFIQELMRNVETRISSIQSLVIAKGTDSYIGSPVLVTDGDAVLHGLVSTVTSKNQVVLSTGQNAATNYGTYNYSNCIGQVVSGANSGLTFSVRSNSSTTLYTDRDCTALSGQAIKIMPYRIVNTYSGWSYAPGAYPTVGTNRAGGGIICRLGVTETIPAKVGSLVYSTGYYSGVVSVSHPLTVLAGSTIYDTPGLYSGSVIAIQRDLYGRSPRVGDVVYYNPSSSLSVTHTGLILDVRNHAVPAQGSTAITVYTPDSAPHGSSSYTIYRRNDLHIQSFPEFNSTYTITASEIKAPFDPSSFAVVNMTGIDTESILINTPYATVDFAANEYESSFENVTATSNFHIGPVHLSNGQILDDALTMTGGVPPYLYFSGSVLNGDPVSMTTIISQQGFSTQNPSVAHLYTGLYYSNGIMTIAANTNFNASETIQCKTKIRYGSIVLDRVFTVPVQPAI